tara:strand:- start:548 stop:1099 length:552 start_codon:yes stop_codon:yes gene_type:complete
MTFTDEANNDGELEPEPEPEPEQDFDFQPITYEYSANAVLSEAALDAFESEQKERGLQAIINEALKIENIEQKRLVPNISRGSSGRIHSFDDDAVDSEADAVPSRFRRDLLFRVPGSYSELDYYSPEPMNNYEAEPLQEPRDIAEPVALDSEPEPEQARPKSVFCSLKMFFKRLFNKIKMSSS